MVMTRPRKKEINLSKDSILSLLQEIYNELVEQRATAIRVQNKMLTMLKDPEDMTTIGPVLKNNKKLLMIVLRKKLVYPNYNRVFGKNQIITIPNHFRLRIWMMT